MSYCLFQANRFCLQGGLMQCEYTLLLLLLLSGTCVCGECNCYDVDPSGDWGDIHGDTCECDERNCFATYDRYTDDFCSGIHAFISIWSMSEWCDISSPACRHWNKPSILFFATKSFLLSFSDHFNAIYLNNWQYSITHDIKVILLNFPKATHSKMLM